jgi:hypothetical protein
VKSYLKGKCLLALVVTCALVAVGADGLAGSSGKLPCPISPIQVEESASGLDALEDGLLSIRADGSAKFEKLRAKTLDQFARGLDRLQDGDVVGATKDYSRAGRTLDKLRRIVVASRSGEEGVIDVLAGCVVGSETGIISSSIAVLGDHIQETGLTSGRLTKRHAKAQAMVGDGLQLFFDGPDGPQVARSFKALLKTARTTAPFVRWSVAESP